MKKWLLVVGSVAAFGLLTAESCGSESPAASPSPSATASAKVADTFLQYTVDGASIYFDISDPSLVPAVAKLSTAVAGIPVASGVSCSNSAGTFFVWNDGTADSKSLADAFCKGAKFK